MKTLSRRTLRLWLTLFILGCGSDPIQTEQNDEFRYPMVVGNSWRYSQTYAIADTSAGTAWHVTDSGYVRTGVTAMETWGPLYKFRLDMQYLTDQDTTNSTDWYLQSTNGLYSFAYENAGSGLGNPAPGQPQCLIGGKWFVSIEDGVRYFIEGRRPVRDEVHYEDPPKQTYSYTLEVGAKWIFRSYDEPFWIQKTCIGREIVTTVDGNYDCFVIKIEYDMDEDRSPDTDFIGYEWVAREGLVKRQFLGEGLVWDEGQHDYLLKKLKNELLLLSYHKSVVTPFE